MTILRSRLTTARRIVTSLAFAILATTALLALAGPATGSTFEVTSIRDAGDGSLRTAIHRANEHPGFDRIVVEAAGKIRLGSPLPDLKSDLLIRGRGARRLVLWGETRFPNVFEIPNRRASVTLSGMTIRNAPTAIENAGTLNVVGSRLRGNGTAIWNDGGSLTVARSSVSENGWLEELDDDRHGAISGSGDVTIRRSSVNHNESSGIRVDDDASARIVISRSTLSRHSRGGVYHDFNVRRSTLVLRRSTLHANSGLLGGVWLPYGSVVITQSTLSDNGNGVIAHDAVVRQSTIYGSTWAINIYATSAATLESTILGAAGSRNCEGAITSLGSNLADDHSCGLTGPGDMEGVDPLLRPFGDYGGPTKTFALAPGSPAIDAGFAGGAKRDQRGFRRVVNYPGVPKPGGGDNSDIGAFELQRP